MKLPALVRTAPTPASTAPASDPALAAERGRLVERMTIMQSELGGLFYEMAIRDHVRMDVLMARAAELQAVDLELAELDRRIESLTSE